MKRPWALPLVPLYAADWVLRSLGFRVGLERVQRLAWPVVSVGSLSAGGAGKTPFVIAMARLMREQGVAVDVLSRGYGRTERTVVRVDATGGADAFGDEPLLIAREAGVPVFVGARRYEAGVVAEAGSEAGPSAALRFAQDDNFISGPGRVHLLDDGFQHRQLGRDLDVVLVSSEDLEDWLLPAGDRREPLSALRRADVLAIAVGDDAAVDRVRAMGLGQPIWRFRREMVVPEVRGPVVAFCGIARPGQFFAGLERAGVVIAARRAFPDHHRFEANEIDGLRRLMAECGAGSLVTTAKDYVRMGETIPRLRAPVAVADLRTVFENEVQIAEWLQTRIASIPSRSGSARVPGGAMRFH